MKRDPVKDEILLQMIEASGSYSRMTDESSIYVSESQTDNIKVWLTKTSLKFLAKICITFFNTSRTQNLQKSRFVP